MHSVCISGSGGGGGVLLLSCHYPVHPQVRVQANLMIITSVAFLASALALASFFILALASLLVAAFFTSALVAALFSLAMV